MIYIANCPALIWLFEIIDTNIMNNTFPHIIFVVKQDLPSFTWIHKKLDSLQTAHTLWSKLCYNIWRDGTSYKMELCLLWSTTRNDFIGS